MAGRQRGQRIRRPAHRLARRPGGHVTTQQGLLDQQFGALIDNVRQARLADILDALESACHTLLHHMADHPVPPALRQAWVDLREMLSQITPSAPACLLGHDCACTNSLRERDRDEHP